MRDTKVFLLGLDGATWDLIMPWISEGELPTFKMLIKGGAWGILESCIPPITLPAWACMLTGKNPGKIGAVHFLMRSSESYEFKVVKLYLEKVNPLWSMLNTSGKRSALFYVPTIAPDFQSFNGMYIPSDVIPCGEYPYPQQLSTLINKFGLDESPPKLGRVDPAEYIRWWCENTRRHFEFINYFLDRVGQWDFLMHVIYSNDHLSHLFWKYIDKKHPDYERDDEIYEAFLNYYKVIDNMLRNVIQKCNSRNIIFFLVSDHGHGPLVKRIDLNRWLLENGYLRIREDLKNSSGKREASKFSEIFKKKVLESPVIRSRFVCRLLKRMPYVRRLLRQIFVNLDVRTDVVDWQNTKAYFAGYNGININLKGREPEGIVEVSEYEKVRSDLINMLKQLRDPETGITVVKNVYRREEIYWGDCLSRLPDIVIEYINESFYESCLSFGETFLKRDMFYKPSDPPVSSAHTRRGIFLAYGPDIRCMGDKPLKVSIYDITPTILHIFSLPIPNDIDGKVLTEIFDLESSIAKRKPAFVNPDYYQLKISILKLRKKVKKYKQ